MSILNDLDKPLNDTIMPLSGHLQELRSRFFHSVVIFLLSCLICSLKIKNIVFFLQQLAPTVKFLQLAPGEYFFSSIKVILYTSICISGPFFLYQILLFILPGLTKRERNIIIPLSIISIILFILGLVFAYFVLIPAALNFFIRYGSDLVEPLWSLEQYLDFILILLLSTGLAFQVPIIQVLLGFFGIITSKTMLSLWRYILLFSTIAGAVLTPSVDPLTQILLSSAIFSLYFVGIGSIMVIDKFNN
uniref:Sec-independent periplasmic protein translocase n=1 Tax=Flintiella sanguinaria TaxID=101926 RepID=A0A1X9PUH0_9RHOD|nr:sec-independent periplasmic protein translocase [Flintiella sanguinaria]